MDLLITAGTRPELIRLFPILKQLEKRNVDYYFVWSGQHFQYEMSTLLFEELKIPKPDSYINLDLNYNKTYSHLQLSELIKHIGNQLIRVNPKFSIAFGDTDTVLATSLSSAKCKVPFIHLEAGCRSGSLAMPEEINRIISDHISSFLFSPSKISTLNLLSEGIPRLMISTVGNPIVDALTIIKPILNKKEDILLSDFGLEKRNYVLLTVHRQENVDNPRRLLEIIDSIVSISKELIVFFPIHPRTEMRLKEFSLYNKLKDEKNIIVSRPVGYIDFITLLKNSLLIITDSGGVQIESFSLNIPTITLRYNTEWPETVILGVNFLSGPSRENILRAFKKIRGADFKREFDLKYRPYGNGNSSKKIMTKIKEILENHEDYNLFAKERDMRGKPLLLKVLMRKNELEENDHSYIVGYIGEKLPIVPNPISLANYSLVLKDVSVLDEELINWLVNID